MFDDDLYAKYSYALDKLLTHWGRDQNVRHSAHDIFKCIFSNENVWISIKISLKFVPQGPINNLQHWFR